MSSTAYETKESPIADPGPLGLACFALTTFCLSMVNAGFILLTVGATGIPTAHTLGGYVGILTAIAAWYTSAAGIWNTVWGRVVLPVGPFKK